MICIRATDASNERIRQAVTSEFSHGSLETTFRQACTAEQKRAKWNS